MLTTEDLAHLAEFLAESRIAVVATNSPSGFPQVTPNWFNWDGERLSISTTRERLKYINLSRDPRVTVLIYQEPMASHYVTLRGRVEIQDDDSIWEPTRAILGRHLPAGQADAYIQRMRDTEHRVVLWLRPERMARRAS